MGVFDSAKKWINTEGQKLLTADRRKAERLEEQQLENERQLERDAGEQVLRMVAPDLVAKMDRHTAGSAERERQHEADRLRNAQSGTVELRFSGDIDGALHGEMATTVVREGDDLWVTVEPREPVDVGGVAFGALTLAIADSGRGGVLEAGGPQFDGIEYMLVLDGAEEGYFWHESYGPGQFEFRADGALHLDLVYRDSGGSTVRIDGTITTAWT